MHDYLATDGETSVQPSTDDYDNMRQLYSGNRDKSKVRHAGWLKKCAR